MLPLRAALAVACLSTSSTVSATSLSCPIGFKSHPPGYWRNALPGPPGHPAPPLDGKNTTPALCGRKCKTWHDPCVGFEVSVSECYIFPKALEMPFTPYDAPGQNVTTCIVDGFTPP